MPLYGTHLAVVLIPGVGVWTQSQFVQGSKGARITRVAGRAEGQKVVEDRGIDSVGMGHRVSTGWHERKVEPAEVARVRLKQAGWNGCG